MNKLIYVAGDSFTAGEDIGDFLIPGAQSRNILEWDNIQKNDISRLWFQHRNKIIQDDPGLGVQFDICNKENRWSTILSNLTNTTVINSSIGGSSFYEIMYKTLHDVLSLKTQGKEIVDVLVQLTSPDRYAYFTDNHKYQKNYNKEKYLIYSFMRTGTDEPFNFYTDAHYDAQPFHFTVYRFFVDLMFFDNAMINLMGKSPIYVDSVFYKNDFRFAVSIREIVNDWFLVLKRNRHLVSPEIMAFAQDMIKNRIELAMDDGVKPTDRVWTTNFHLDETIHKRFAERVAARYFSD